MDIQLRNKLIVAEETVEVNKQECFVDAGWTPHRDKLAAEMNVILKMMKVADLKAEVEYAEKARDDQKSRHPGNRFAGVGWEAYRKRVASRLKK